MGFAKPNDANSTPLHGNPREQVADLSSIIPVVRHTSLLLRPRTVLDTPHIVAIDVIGDIAYERVLLSHPHGRAFAGIRNEDHPGGSGLAKPALVHPGENCYGRASCKAEASRRNAIPAAGLFSIRQSWW